jgi:hypothetical protein
MEDEWRTDAEKKVSIYIEFLIQQKKFETVVKYVDIDIMNKFNLMHLSKGLGTFLDVIEESVEIFDQTYVDLTIMFIYYYKTFTDIGSSQLISTLIKAFGNKKFVWD